MLGRTVEMRRNARRFTWLWATLAVVMVIGLLVAVDLIEDPDSTALDIAFNLIEEAPLVLIAIGIIVLIQSIQRQRVENRHLISDLQIARNEGRHWRRETQTHLKGVGDAIGREFSRWNLSIAERDVALLLLKGMTHKEIAALRTTSERTVREQARSIYRKAGLNSRAALSAYFLEDLLVPADMRE